jgi:hypothetical protein
MNQLDYVLLVYCHCRLDGAAGRGQEGEELDLLSSTMHVYVYYIAVTLVTRVYDVVRLMPCCKCLPSGLSRRVMQAKRMHAMRCLHVRIQYLQE